MPLFKNNSKKSRILEHNTCLILLKFLSQHLSFIADRLFGCGWLFRRPRLLSVSSVVSSLSVALHSQAAPGSWWNALSCRACSKWICLQCLPVIDSTLQRCHELSFWAAHLPLSLVVGVWLRTADHVPSPGHFHWAMMNYLAGGDDCGSTESYTIIGLHGESSI